MLDAQTFLDEPPHALPARIVGEAESATGGPVALYVVDIAGELLRRVAGAAGMPAEIAVPSAIGPELGDDDIRRLAEQLADSQPRCVVAPLWVRDRATCVLVAAHGPLEDLERIALAAAPVVELAPGYTDVFDRARRPRAATAAAEIQQDLLSPRRAAVEGARIAASVIPAYDVGGDWFDHAENGEGVWLAVADAMGRGLRASAVSSVAVGALRAARRAGGGLEECCDSVDAAVDELESTSFVTMVLGTWHASTGTLAWINCGHPPPLLIGSDGTPRELEGAVTHPLGLWRDRRDGFRRNEVHLEPGDRVVFYSDGVTDRRTTESDMIGFEGLVETLEGLGGCNAAETVQGVERMIRAVSTEELADDATQLVLEVLP